MAEARVFPSLFIKEEEGDSHKLTVFLHVKRIPEAEDVRYDELRNPTKWEGVIDI